MPKGWWRIVREFILEGDGGFIDFGAIITSIPVIGPALQAVASLVNPAYNPPLAQVLGLPAPSPGYVAPSAAPTYYNGGGAFPTYQAMGATPAALYSAPGMDLARVAPGLVGTAAGKVPHWIRDILFQYGPPVAMAVWTEFQKRRRAGQPSGEARAALMAANPVSIHRHRRRMNPTNRRALRRAIRRVRSARRVLSKIRGLYPQGGRGGRRYYYRRPRRRGDLSPFYSEDRADVVDEWEDLGYDPGEFSDEDDRE